MTKAEERPSSGAAAAGASTLAQDERQPAVGRSAWNALMADYEAAKAAAKRYDDEHRAPAEERFFTAQRAAGAAAPKSEIARLSALTGYDAAEEGHGRLLQAAWSIEKRLLDMPAPDAAAFLWKLAFLAENGDFGDHSKAVTQDALRLTADADPVQASGAGQGRWSAAWSAYEAAKAAVDTSDGDDDAVLALSRELRHRRDALFAVPSPNAEALLQKLALVRAHYGTPDFDTVEEEAAIAADIRRLEREVRS